ncbi:MAG: hypothetical protein M3362_09850 [Acidobacteriota bacterium]|nr:hypothetical protein [Acidobacteriota bacterium]
MADSSDQSNNESTPICIWCEEPIPSEEIESGRRVCDRCVRLLTKAGLTNGEIFSGKGRDKD